MMRFMLYTLFAAIVLHCTPDAEGGIFIPNTNADITNIVSSYVDYYFTAGTKPLYINGTTGTAMQPGFLLDYPNTGPIFDFWKVSTGAGITNVIDSQGNFNIRGIGSFKGNAALITNVPVTAIVGGWTTNLPVLIADNRTNILQFNNGILTAITSQ